MTISKKLLIVSTLALSMQYGMQAWNSPEAVAYIHKAKIAEILFFAETLQQLNNPYANEIAQWLKQLELNIEMAYNTITNKSFSIEEKIYFFMHYKLIQEVSDFRKKLRQLDNTKADEIAGWLTNDWGRYHKGFELSDDHDLSRIIAIIRANTTIEEKIEDFLFYKKTCANFTHDEYKNWKKTQTILPALYHAKHH